MTIGKVTVKSNKRQVESELEAKIARALDKIGLTAVSGASILCPVDTSNLRDSITHKVDHHTVHVGTNVEYGKYVEFNDRAVHTNGQAHFLRDTIKGQLGEYRIIAQNELKY